MIHRYFSVLATVSILFSLQACNRRSAAPEAIPTNTATSAAGRTSGQDGCDNDFYPVRRAATWTYKFSGGVSGQFTRTVLNATPAGFATQDVFTTGANHIGTWQCDDGALTALQPDEGATGSVQFNDPIENFQTSEVSGVTVPDQLVPGATWNEELLLQGTRLSGGQEVPARDAVKLQCTGVDVESVRVPAGIFKAMRGDCKTDEKVTLSTSSAAVPTDMVTMSTVWYAPGLGLVKSEQVANGTRTTVQLTTYQIP